MSSTGHDFGMTSTTTSAYGRCNVRGSAVPHKARGRKWKEIQCLQSVFRSGSARLPPPSHSLLCSLAVWPPRRPPLVLAAGSTTAPGAESEPSVFASRLRQECKSQPSSSGEKACVRQVKKFEIFLNGSRDA